MKYSILHPDQVKRVLQLLLLLGQAVSNCRWTEQAGVSYMDDGVMRYLDNVQGLHLHDLTSSIESKWYPNLQFCWSQMTTISPSTGYSCRNPYEHFRGHPAAIHHRGLAGTQVISGQATQLLTQLGIVALLSLFLSFVVFLLLLLLL